MVVPGGSTQSFPPIPTPSPPPPVRGLAHAHSCLSMKATFVLNILRTTVLKLWASMLAGQTLQRAHASALMLPSFARGTSTSA
jgi:hypothetical protein